MLNKEAAVQVIENRFAELEAKIKALEAYKAKAVNLEDKPEDCTPYIDIITSCQAIKYSVHRLYQLSQDGHYDDVICRLGQYLDADFNGLSDSRVFLEVVDLIKARQKALQMKTAAAEPNVGRTELNSPRLAGGN